MDEDFDVFVSYASEDYGEALACRQEIASLRVAFDPIENRPPSSILGVAKANALSMYRRLRGREREALLKTEDQIRGELRSLMDRSRSILVVWSYSHRGSMWANEEVSYFEQRYPERQVFCVKVEQLEAPQRWTVLEASSTLIRERIEAPSQRRASAKPGANEPRGLNFGAVLLQPLHWVRRAMELRAGTTLSELLRLRLRHRDDRNGAEVVKAGRDALFVAIGITGLMMVAAALSLLTARPTEPAFARNAVLAVTLLWICLLFASIQTSLAAVIPAAIVGSVVGLVGEAALLVLNNTDGGAAGGAAVGAFMSVLAAYQWRLSTAQRGRAMGWAEWSWVLRAIAVAIGGIGLLALPLSLIVAHENGKIQGPMIGVVAILLVIVPFAATWIEVSRWGRLKEFFVHGVRPAIFVLVWFLALAAGIWALSPNVDNHRFYSGFVAGPVAGLCLSIMYLMPGMILGTRIPAHVRTLGAVGGVSGALLLLAVLLPLIDDRQLHGDIGQLLISYALALLVVGVLTQLLLSRFKGVTHG